MGLSEKISLPKGIFTPAEIREDTWRAAGENVIWNVYAPGFSSIVVRGLEDDDPIDNLKLLITIPEGTKYMEAATEKLNSRKIENLKYVENYNNSGKNVLICSFAPTTASRLNRLFNNGGIEIVTKVTGDIWSKNKAELYALVDDQLVGKANSRFDEKAVKDEFDLDKDNDTDEEVGVSTAFFTAIDGNQLTARLYVANKDSNNWNSQGLRIEAGKQFSYRLRNYNSNKTEDIYSIYGGFSHLGDKTLARNAETNDFEARNSEFGNSLTGPITLSDSENFVVYYTTEELTPDNMTTAVYQENVADFSAVRGFKVALRSGKSFRKDTGLDVFIPVQQPQNQTIAEKAYFDFVITKDDVSYVPSNQVYNEVRGPEGVLKVIKKDKDTQAVLNGVKFVVYAVNDADEVDPNPVIELTTDGKGEAEAELPVGKYKLEEKEALAGYVPVTETFAPEIEADQVWEKTVYNEKIKGSIKIIKVDKDKPEKLLAGAKFRLTSGCRENLWTGETTCSFDVTATTDNQGEVVFADLLLGDYNIEEIEPPQNYIFEENPTTNQEIRFNEEITVTDAHQVVKTVANKHDKVKLTFRKVDGANNQPIHGIFFSLLKDGKSISEISMSGEQVDTTLKPEGSTEYFNDPQAGVVEFANLEPGTYKVHELKSRDYIPIDDFEVVVEENTNLGDIINYKVENKIVVIKTDKDSGQPLGGVSFDLICDGKIDEKQSGVTDDKGRLEFSKLLPGEYQLVETVTKDGYILPPADSVPIIEIRGHNEEFNVQVLNEKKKIPPNPLPEPNPNPKPNINTPTVPFIIPGSSQCPPWQTATTEQRVKTNLPKTGERNSSVMSLLLIGMGVFIAGCMVAVKAKKLNKTK